MEACGNYLSGNLQFSINTLKGGDPKEAGRPVNVDVGLYPQSLLTGLIVSFD